MILSTIPKVQKQKCPVNASQEAAELFNLCSSTNMERLSCCLLIILSKGNSTLAHHPVMARSITSLRQALSLSGDAQQQEQQQVWQGIYKVGPAPVALNCIQLGNYHNERTACNSILVCGAAMNIGGFSNRPWQQAQVSVCNLTMLIHDNNE